jgi:HK97 family phage major capsid protein
VYHLIPYTAIAVFALLAVWLALEPRAGLAKIKPLRLLANAARHGIALALKPLTFDPLLVAYSLASGQGREGIAKRTVRGCSKRSRYFRGIRRLLQDVGFSAAFSLLIRPTSAMRFAFPLQGGSPELDELEAELDLSDGEKQEAAKLGKQVEELRAKLVDRLGDMKASSDDKVEVERREKELGEKVDALLGLARKQESEEVKAFREELGEKLEKLEKQMGEALAQPASGAKGAVGRQVKAEDRYAGDNLFMDMVKAVKKGDHKLAEQIMEHEEKFAGPDRLKAWANEDLEDVDLIIPEIQAALPFLRAQARAVRLFREIRVSSPAIEFPVFKTGLKVGHVKEGEGKPESEPEFDLEVARVFTIAGISDVPNPTLEDFPAARGWIATELGAATGAQEETDVLLGDGEGEPLGLLSNEDLGKRKVDAVEKASPGRNLITSIFRAAQQVRAVGFVEPTDGLLNPATWTDIALSFEDAIGFLYAPIQTEGTPSSGPVLDQPPPRILGLPITWSAYVPTDEGGGKDESPIVVGNFMDGIILRRAPFRIDVDTSVGFKKNLTSFRGEERMGFIVVRPKSFVKITGAKPTPVEGE